MVTASTRGMKRASHAATGSRMNPRSQAKKNVRIRSEKIVQTAASWFRTTKNRAIDPSVIRIVSQRRSRGVRKTVGAGVAAGGTAGCTPAYPAGTVAGPAGTVAGVRAPCSPVASGCASGCSTSVA